MTAPVGHVVTVWCEDPSHDKPVRIVGFQRVSEESRAEMERLRSMPWSATPDPAGEQERPYAPYLWVDDTVKYQNRRVAGTHLPPLGESLDSERVLQFVDERGVDLRCPRCGHARVLSWSKLRPILERLGEGSVERLSMQSLARILR